jgi:hypothetical protein
VRFNPPPGWPSPPTEDWLPPPGWQPDPSWPKAPRRWNWWTVTASDARTREPLTGLARVLLWAATATALASAALLVVTTSPSLAAAVGAVWLPVFVAALAAFGVALIRLLSSSMPGLPRPDGRLRGADEGRVRASRRGSDPSLHRRSARLRDHRRGDDVGCTVAARPGTDLNHGINWTANGTSVRGPRSGDGAVSVAASQADQGRTDWRYSNEGFIPRVFISLTERSAGMSSKGL